MNELLEKYTTKVYDVSEDKLLIDVVNVVITKRAFRDLQKLPKHIALKLQAWTYDVRHRVLHRVRLVSGYHDEPLKGKRKRQRSIRLSKAYRAIYTLKQNATVKYVEILEVNKHDY